MPKPAGNWQEIGLTYLNASFPTAVSRIQEINVEYYAPETERACIMLVGPVEGGPNPMSAEQLTNEERQCLEELKRQLDTSAVAPPDTLGFGRRFAEIISRMGDLKKPKPARSKKKNKQV